MSESSYLKLFVLSFILSFSFLHDHFRISSIVALGNYDMLDDWFSEVLVRAFDD